MRCSSIELVRGVLQHPITSGGKGVVNGGDGRLIDTSVIKPTLQATFPLNEGAKAFEVEPKWAFAG